MFVKPKKDLKLIDPATMSFVPEEGMQVADGDQFWMRRVRDGDVTVEEQNENQEQPPTQKNEEGGAE